MEKLAKEQYIKMTNLAFKYAENLPEENFINNYKAFQKGYEAALRELQTTANFILK